MKKCENVKKVFAARITELGAAENASAFARTCGLKQQDISRYLTQGALPVSDKLVQIATRFNVSTDWLLGLSDHRTGPPPGQITATNSAVNTNGTTRIQVTQTEDRLLSIIESQQRTLEKLAK